jgi:hypothetical protein
MTFGAPTEPTEITHADLAAQLDHIACMQRRQECLAQTNCGVGFFGVFLATSLALWAFGVARERR